MFVVPPASIAALLATILWPAALALGVPVVLLILTLVGSWFGVASLVRLTSHYARSNDLPRSPRMAALVWCLPMKFASPGSSTLGWVNALVDVTFLFAQADKMIRTKPSANIAFILIGVFFKSVAK